MYELGRPSSFEKIILVNLYLNTGNHKLSLS